MIINANFKCNFKTASIRMYHNKRTNASVNQIKNIIKDLTIFPICLKPISKSLFKYRFNYKKSLYLFENTGETYKITELFLKRSKKNLMAFTNNTNKLKLNYSINFENLMSSINLYNSWLELKNKTFFNSSQNNIKPLWFKQTSKQLIKGNFQYCKNHRIQIWSKKNLKSLVLDNLKMKIIKKTLFNAIEPVFEGLWSWVHINNHQVIKKHWIYKPKLNDLNYGLRPDRTIHTALKAIKHWKKNTIWVLEYDIRKTFNDINNKRLKNIFLLNIPKIRIWKEIEKMLNANLLNIDNCFENKNTNNDALASLLFNIYLNEFDKFICQRSTNLSFLKKNINLKTTKNYNQFILQFSKNKIINTLSKYNSVKILELILEKKKKMYYTELRKNSNSYFLEYIRYTNNFLISINGPKKLAFQLQNQINKFIKSNLHLTIKHNKIINQSKSFFTFLDFKIYLNKFQKNWKHQQNNNSLAKYQKRLQNRTQKFNSRLSKATIFKIKKQLIKTVRTSLSKNNNKFNQQNIKNLFQSQLNQLIPIKKNLALKNWEKHFEKLFQKNLALALKFYYSQIESEIIPRNKFYHLKVIKLKDKFFGNLKKIEQKIFKKAKKEKINNKNQYILSQRIKINAPILKLFNYFTIKNFYHLRHKKPIANLHLVKLNDNKIITYYLNIICNLINYYRPVDNFDKIKKLSENLQKSCYLTLSYKHKKTIKCIYNIYKKNYNINTSQNNMLFLPTIEYISNLNFKYIISKNFQIVFKKYEFHKNDYNKCYNRNIKFFENLQLKNRK